jgi:hypothetical protein
MSSPESVIQHQIDFAHLRRHRVAGEQTEKQIKKAAIGIIFTGAVAAFWIGFKDMLIK